MSVLDNGLKREWLRLTAENADLSVRTAKLVAALEEIVNMCPATSDVTAAHAMAQVAEEALQQSTEKP